MKPEEFSFNPRYIYEKERDQPVFDQVEFLMDEIQVIFDKTMEQYQDYFVLQDSQCYFPTKLFWLEVFEYFQESKSKYSEDFTLGQTTELAFAIIAHDDVTQKINGQSYFCTGDVHVALGSQSFQKEIADYFLPPEKRPNKSQLELMHKVKFLKSFTAIFSTQLTLENIAKIDGLEVSIEEEAFLRSVEIKRNSGKALSIDECGRLGKIESRIKSLIKKIELEINSNYRVILESHPNIRTPQIEKQIEKAKKRTYKQKAKLQTRKELRRMDWEGVFWGTVTTINFAILSVYIATNLQEKRGYVPITGAISFLAGAATYYNAKSAKEQNKKIKSKREEIAQNEIEIETMKSLVESYRKIMGDNPFQSPSPRRKNEKRDS
jgi:hypothetical protein